MNKTLSKLSNIDKMSKKELVKTVKDYILPLTDPTAYKEMVKGQLPDLVKDLDNRETAGQAILQASQEFLLAVVETLKLFNGFTDEQIKTFIKDLQGNLTIVKEIEEGGLSILSDHSMQKVVQMVRETGVEKMLQKIAEIRYQKEKTWKAGLEHPRVLEGSNIERQIQKPK